MANRELKDCAVQLRKALQIVRKQLQNKNINNELAETLRNAHTQISSTLLTVQELTEKI